MLYIFTMHIDSDTFLILLHSMLCKYIHSCHNSVSLMINTDHMVLIDDSDSKFSSAYYVRCEISTEYE